MPTPETSTFTQLVRDERFAKLEAFMRARSKWPVEGSVIWWENPDADVFRQAEAVGFVSAVSATQVEWTENGAEALRSWRLERDGQQELNPMTVIGSLAVDAAADAIIDLIDQEAQHVIDTARAVAIAVLQAVLYDDQERAEDALARRIDELTIDFTAAFGAPRPEDALSFDEVEAAGLDGTLR